MTFDWTDRDRRMVAYALWLQGHALLSASAAAAQKTSRLPIEAVRELMDDGNRLLAISQQIREETSNDL